MSVDAQPTIWGPLTPWSLDIPYLAKYRISKFSLKIKLNLETKPYTNPTSTPLHFICQVANHEKPEDGVLSLILFIEILHE